MNFLKRIFSKSKPEAELPELPPEFEQADPPDWLIDLKGASLAQGNRFSIRVQLTTATRRGTTDVVILPRKEGEHPISLTVLWNSHAVDKLFVILGFSFPEEIADVPASPADALPIDLTIHRREPYSLSAANCNLGGAWLGSKKSGPPAIEISRILLAAAEPALRGKSGAPS